MRLKGICHSRLRAIEAVQGQLQDQDGLPESAFDKTLAKRITEESLDNVTLLAQITARTSEGDFYALTVTIIVTIAKEYETKQK